MAYSRVGWATAVFRLANSWMSFAPSNDLAWSTPSSNADLVALKFRADRRSKAANWELAKPRMASTPALFVAAICSGVTYMIISIKVACVSEKSVLQIPQCLYVYCTATQRILQIKQVASRTIFAMQ